MTPSPAWPRTVLIITFDEWGGFFDHVAPGTPPDTTPALTGLRGFRVPYLVISPWARRGVVAHRLYDHGLDPQADRDPLGLGTADAADAAANNLADVLDFTHPVDIAAPQWQFDGPVAAPCPPALIQLLGHGA